MDAPHADVEYMRFSGGNREHAIGNDFGGTLQHPAFITGRKAIAKDGVSPGKRIGAQFNAGHRFQIGRAHGAETGEGLLEIGDHGAWLNKAVCLASGKCA